MKFLKHITLLSLFFILFSCTEEQVIDNTVPEENGFVTRYRGEVPYIVKETANDYVFQGDILFSKSYLTENPEIASGSSNTRTQSTGKSIHSTRWPNNVLVYQDYSDMPNAQQDHITNAMNHYREKTNIDFKLRENEANYAVFRTPDSGEHPCSAALGMQGGPQRITLGSCGFGTTVHEIGHALGLYHEHTRSDRDSTIFVDFDNIEEDAKHNFTIHSGDEFGSDYTDEIDFNSIMMYSSFAFNIDNNLPTMTRRSDGGVWFGQFTELSLGDIEGLNKMYPSITPAAVDDITDVEAIGTIGSIERIKISVTYSATQARDLILMVQQDHSPYNAVLTKTLRVNPGTDVDVFWTNFIPNIDENDTYQIQTILAPIGGNWNNNLDFMTANAVEEPENPTGGSEDKIISLEAPLSVTPGSTANVALNYSATSNRDLIVMLQQDHAPWNEQVAQTVVVPSGNNQSVAVSLVVPEGINVNDTYQFQTILAPTGGGWNDKFDNAESAVSVEAPVGNTDDIISAIVPNSVTAGSNATISVRYSSSTDRDIIVFFQDGSGSFSVHSEAKIDVSEGSSTEEINIAIPSGLNESANYQFNIIITTDGGNYSNKFDEEPKPDISYQAGNSNPALYIKNIATGKYLFVANSNDNTSIQTGNRQNTDFFKWEKIATSSGYFYLKNVATGKYFRPANAADASLMQQKPTNFSGSWTQWREVQLGGGIFHFQNRNSQKYIRPQNNNNPSNVQLRPTTWSGSWTRWQYESTTSGQ